MTSDFEIFWIPPQSFPEVRATFLIPPRGLGEKKGVQQVRVLDKRYDIDVYSLVKSGQIPSSEGVGPQEDIYKNAC